MTWGEFCLRLVLIASGNKWSLEEAWTYVLLRGLLTDPAVVAVPDIVETLMKAEEWDALVRQWVFGVYLHGMKRALIAHGDDSNVFYVDMYHGVITFKNGAA